jgi:hypothetical protein
MLDIGYSEAAVFAAGVFAAYPRHLFPTGTMGLLAMMSLKSIETNAIAVKLLIRADRPFIMTAAEGS